MTKNRSLRRLGRHLSNRHSGTERRILVALFGVLGCGMIPMSASALEFDTGNPDLKIRWDNTIKYSAAYRLHNPDSVLIVDANTDDGDRNFHKGLISNRVDLLSELDVAYKDSGLRISGASWYDSIYNRSNGNNSPTTASQTSVSANEFTDTAKSLHGKNSELLDAFAYTRFDLGNSPVSIRAGRHTVLYGETLFFGGNGIAGGQAPFDVIKLLSVPGSQFKELLMPVKQVSTQLQINQNVTVGGYYQFEWRPNRLPAAGSYFAFNDYATPGAERFFAPGSYGAVWFDRVADKEAKNSGQGGLQLRFHPDSEFAEFGLYATRYHDKNFNLYLFPTGGFPSIGTYQRVFGEDISAYGASASSTIAGANVALEVSTRHNAPLVSDPVVAFGAGNTADSAAYAVGNTAHINLSSIKVLNGTSLWNGGAVLAELAWNRRLSVTRNPTSLDPNVTRDAVAMRMLFSPEYYQVMPGIDLTVPVGLGYLINGRSSSDVTFGGGAEKGGDFSIGTTFDYRKIFKAGLNYVHFYGSAAPFITPNVAPTATVLPYQQTLKDRDFISFTIQSTF